VAFVVLGFMGASAKIVFKISLFLNFDKSLMFQENKNSEAGTVSILM
jgi:hypothetical protein